MPSVTFGTGTDIFAIDYLDAQVPNSGATQWQSSDIYSHMLSSLQYKNITSYFEDAPSTAMSDRNDANTPFNRVTEGASTGYYRTVSYKSQPATNPYFTQNVLMYDRHIITNVTDIQRLIWKPTISKSSVNITPLGGNSQTVTKYSVSSFESNKVSIFKRNDNEHYTTTDINIVPAIISPLRTNALQAFPFWGSDMDYTSWVDSIVYRYGLTYGSNRNNQKRFLPEFEGLDALPNSNNETTVYAISKNGRYLVEITYRAGDMYSYMTNTYAHAKYYCISEDEFLYILASSGLKFEYNNTVYKPIAENGVITGYTDDMTKESEWDNWHDYTDHDVPITPPSPTGANENEEIEMPLAHIGGTGGFVQFIKINSAGLASANDISAALSRFDIATIGKDLLRNFVSYKCFAVLSIDPNDTVTRQITVDGHGLTDENSDPLNGQVIGSVLPIDFEIGTPTRYFNDFRDFAPYTKIEAYVPFCGWFTLPSWCIGRKITGTMFTDLYNGTVKAVIFAGSTVVAEIGGCCAYDIPFVADATGAKAGAVISSALSTAAATAATVSIPNVATGIAAVTSAANTISALNSNDTTLKGVLGDGSNLNGLLHCYLKITRPQSPTRNNDIPNAYKHEIGIPTYKEMTLTAGDGYTQILDANITGAMTDREKQMIIDGFRHGLIL